MAHGSDRFARVVSRVSKVPSLTCVFFAARYIEFIITSYIITRFVQWILVEREEKERRWKKERRKKRGKILIEIFPRRNYIYDMRHLKGEEGEEEEEK